MAADSKTPVVVAELGRPETPAETAARKAENSRLYRQRKTVNNLVLSLIVTLGVVLVIFLLSPQGADTWKNRSVDVAQSAAENAATAGQTLVAPETPTGWLAKSAELRGGPGGISVWYVGYTTNADAYAAIKQIFAPDGAPIDETWLGEQLENQTATGVETIGGIEWTVYDHPERSADNSNMKFGLQAEVGRTTLRVYGTDDPGAVRGLAAEVAAQAGSIASTVNE